MVEPEDVRKILRDAAWLVREGEIIVFGSAALAFWLADAPSSRDVDIWCEPEEGGYAVTALMGELSWYHDRNGAFVEVWAPETFAAPADWRERARIMTLEDLPDVRLVVPHPHDLLMAKLERMERKDREHAEAILREMPISPETLEALAARMPARTDREIAPDRLARFEAGLSELRAMISRSQ